MERDGDVEKAILAEMAKPEGEAGPLLERVTRNNQIILHNFGKSMEKACDCQLLGCSQTFNVMLIPNQVLYPKFCEEHRSEFRRQNFLRVCSCQKDVFRFETVRVFEPIREPREPREPRESIRH